ncbi:hypothetical protein [Alteromonas ponticola]|uniref:Uncharacterized protein n=1 Tax=Alteromonas ponticola TaxID=2720613 RepID=A0ABX1QXT9_9ALTE|nr:hypothetical protein [Alteromonas ponticola]NMH59055.1 hypothetical protein [Alteromonas ponticola]
MSIQKNLFQSTDMSLKVVTKKKSLAKLCSFLAPIALAFTVSQSVNATAYQCGPADAVYSGPVAAWDFNKGDDPAAGNDVVEWYGDHGGVQAIEGTNLQGIKFYFAGKGLEKDATSEWRYTLKTPMSATWEHMRIYQPKNFYHRAGTRINIPAGIDPDLWQPGDKIVNDKGIEATVSRITDTYLYITDFHERFSKHWGSGREIQNLSSNDVFVSTGQRWFPNNNKLSAQWHGRYSNAGMIMETESYTPFHGFENGVSYCRPTINSSVSHKGTGTQDNVLFDRPAECFHPRDNGTVIDLMIERVRSSTLTSEDGSYRIWKKTNRTDWKLVYENTNLVAYQDDNYFTDGYVFGWANSGFNEDTRFYLVGWELWTAKPDFLP